jgi:membrane protease YdiL (CAAX protease family)
VNGKLVAWSTLVGVQIALAYGSRAESGKPEKDAVYHWSLAIGGLVQYAVIFGIVLWIAHPDWRERFALRRPRSWPAALGWLLASLGAVMVVLAAVASVSNPGGEQGLTPHGWQSSHAAAFVGNFVVIALVAPVVEELTFRGLGFSLLRRYGSVVAIVVVGLTFGLAHGLVDALPILATFGVALAFVRERTASIYPCILFHACFNAVNLVLAVTT